MMKIYIGGQGGTVQGEPMHLSGARCFTAAQRPQKQPLENVRCLLDSGAFTDVLQESRRTPSEALERQLAWEESARLLCGAPDWQAEAVVSYDRLIDEKWDGSRRRKERWTVKAADVAVEQTVEAARFLSLNREACGSRKLILTCQGVESSQYADCAKEILSTAQTSDWLGLGGWCILGLHKSWIPEFYRTIGRVLPMCASKGLKRVHIFGVLYAPALGALLWLADAFNLEVSTDSSAPILACTRGNAKKAGVRAESGHWRDNVAWWRQFVEGLRESTFYREPTLTSRQMELFT